MRFFELLDSAHPYLRCFDYDHYPQCFAEFSANAAPFFDGLDPACLPQTAEEIVKLADARWKSRPFWQRAELARQDRSALAIFFAPAAARHSDTAQAFARLLQERWNERFPRNRFFAGDYEAIMKGFDKDFMGIKLRKSKERS